MPDRVPAAVAAQQRAAVHARAVTVFSEALFFKPDEDASGRIEAEFTPLIVQEVALDKWPIDRDRFGAVLADGAEFEIDTTAPTVYAKASSATVRGRRYEQVVYLWLYPTLRSDESGDSLRAQGVRITLNSRGHPCIWEVLADPAGMHVIYVSRSLEEAATAAFGAPFQGRHYVSERAISDRPDVVVVRVLEDGPVPMGPFVYLRAGTRSVSTLLCRCMPSQVDNFVQSGYYELLPLHHLAAINVDVDLDEVLSPLLLPQGGDEEWTSSGDHPNALDRLLRLPSGF